MRATFFRGLLALILWSGMLGIAVAETSVEIIYLRHERELPPVLSNLDPVPHNEGIAGAALALTDIQTTGKFLGQTWTFDVVSVPPEDDPLRVARQALSRTSYLIIDAPRDTLLSIADMPEAQSALLFNAHADDRELRDTECRANVLHTIASADMRTDALMQVLLSKRWTEIVMISGTNKQDKAFGTAMERSAGKFGLRIRDQKTWAYDADMRRSASSEVPLFTQDFGDYDVLLVADEIGDFGQYLLYNTWRPRPVAGSAGMVPRDWAPALEQWAAVQLQNRFEEANGRDMRPKDYAAWLAMRALGEAVTRTKTEDLPTVRSYLLSDAFRLDGFKGRALSFRNWNGQIRTPIPVVHPRAVVAMAPIEGFLHQRTELDTLGLDEPESRCSAF